MTLTLLVGIAVNSAICLLLAVAITFVLMVVHSLRSQ